MKAKLLPIILLPVIFPAHAGECDVSHRVQIRLTSTETVFWDGVQLPDKHSLASHYREITKRHPQPAVMLLQDLDVKPAALHAFLRNAQEAGIRCIGYVETERWVQD